MGRLKLIAAMAIALTASTLLAAPAAAATILDPCTGTCGQYSEQDASGGPWGVTCKFAADTWLHNIKIRPPTVFGTNASKHKVGWRYQVAGGPNSNDTPNLVFTSGWQTAQASTTASARKGHGFSSRTDSLGVTPPTYFWYRILIEMGWWNGSNAPIGDATFRYDWYRNVDAGVPVGEFPGACSWTSE